MIKIMKIFSATYPDFIRFDEKPNEDFFIVSKKYPVFSVADGVTQSHFRNGAYAYPNEARETAKIFCRETVKLIEKIVAEKTVERNDFCSVFNRANQKIMDLNVEYGIDKKLNYVEYDWFDTVGITGVIIKNKLYYCYVGDCGLAIFDKNNKKKFQTKDMVRPAVNKFNKIYGNKNLSKNQRTLIIHRDFRNREDGTGYGSFSGEAGVEKYYKYGIKDLFKGDLVIFYTDGFVKHLKNEKFIKTIRAGDKKNLDSIVMELASDRPEIYGNDRTFISINI